MCGAPGMIAKQNSMYGASPIIVLHYPTFWSISIEILLKIDFIESLWDMQKNHSQKIALHENHKKKKKPVICLLL